MKFRFLLPLNLKKFLYRCRKNVVFPEIIEKFSQIGIEIINLNRFIQFKSNLTSSNPNEKHGKITLKLQLNNLHI